MIRSKPESDRVGGLETLITHVVGARPNFPKAAPVISALGALGIQQRLVHTGQHYDDALSESFFRDLRLPRPDTNLGIGSGSHAQQMGAIMVALENDFLANRPELLVVYGDINSTLAASLVAARLLIPTAHVEAGLRSFDRTMPEEVNRVLTDQLATLLFTTSPEAFDNLTREGVAADRVHFVGNPMIDTLMANLDSFDPRAIGASLGLPNRYSVATIHRPSNVDDHEQAQLIVDVLLAAAELTDLVVPLHPRGRETLKALGLESGERIHVMEPLGYRDFMSLVRGAEAVITDSGGVQEETTILGVPCFTLRPNTERPITISHGTNNLVNEATLIPALESTLRNRTNPSPTHSGSRSVPPLWDGHAGERIARVIEEWMLRL